MPGIGIGISPHFQNKRFSFAQYWTTLTEMNVVIEGHSFMEVNSMGEKYIKDNLHINGFYNSAVHGKSIDTVVSDAATVDSKIITETATRKNILFLWIGVNDMTNNAGIGTTIYNILKPYVVARMAAGWKVFVFTMTPSTYGTFAEQFEVERNIFNNLLRNDLAVANKVVIIDTDLESGLTDVDNPSFFDPDKLHLTAYGHQKSMDLVISDLTTRGAVNVIKDELGDELIQNGDFSSTDGWTTQTTWSITGGEALSGAAAGSGSVYQRKLTIGKTYRVRYSCTEFTDGVFFATFGGAQGIARWYVGDFVEDRVCTAADYACISSWGTDPFVGKIDNVSFREVLYP